MTSRSLTASALLIASLHACAVIRAQEPALPTVDGRPAVATINGEAVALDELTAQLEPPVDTTRLLSGRATATELELLDRLIAVRLLALEAAAMGLADFPEIRKQVDVESRAMLREVLRESLVKDLKPDEAAVEARYKELVREYRTASLLFESEEVGKRIREEIVNGGDFAQIAARALAEKAAKGEGDDKYHRRQQFAPQVAEAIAALEVGQVSPLLRIEAGFVVVKLLDVRYPEDADAREEARQLVLGEQQQAALRSHEQALRAKHVVVHQAVLDSVNYEAEAPGVDALLKDGRIVAEIEGASPVTVGDLTDDLRMQSFHRTEGSGFGKRLNARKQDALEAILGRRLMNVEAQRLGIDKTHAYVDRVNAFEESLVFNAFVQKVIAPESKMREEEVKAYYAAHGAEYATPAMFRLRGLAFTQRAAAEAAVERLRGGTDFGWLASTADHQADKAAEGLLSFDGRPVSRDSMPEALQKALVDAASGDVRLYASPEGHFYALVVQDVVPSKAKPYDEVRAGIAKKLYAEKLKQGIERYAAKLRALSKVEVYLKNAE